MALGEHWTKYLTSRILCCSSVETVILNSQEHAVDSTGNDRMEGMRDGALEEESSGFELQPDDCLPV